MKKSSYSYHLTLVRKKNGRYDKKREFGLGEFFSEVDKNSMRYCSVGLNGLGNVFRLPNSFKLLNPKYKRKVENEISVALDERFDNGFFQGRVGLVMDIFKYKNDLLKNKKVRRYKK